MGERVEALVGRAIPWHRNAAWYLVLLEGIVAVVVGLWIVLHPSSARNDVIRLVGVYLAVTGVLGFVGDLREREGGIQRYSVLRHVLMVAVGVLAAVRPGVTDLIAWGAILVGLAGLLLVIVARDMGAARWGVLVVSAVFLVFGFLLFWALATGTFLFAVFGLALMLAGLLLVAYAVRIVRGHRHAPAVAGSL